MTEQLLQIARREPEDDPSIGQTVEAISEHYRNAKPGDVAVIRETYRGYLSFRYTSVNEVKPPRVYLAHEAEWGGSAFYLASGKNCRSPKGQARLVVPSPEIAAFTAAHPIIGKRIGGSITEFPFRTRFLR